MEREIVVENTPHSVLIKLQDGGGITVLVGDQGCGKSKSLQAVQRLAGNEDIKLTVADGKKRGVVSSGTARISVASRCTASGECDIISLEGRYDIADFVTGGHLANPERADAVRIKGLLQMRGIPAGASTFADLLGTPEELEKYVSPDTLKVSEIVEAAAKIKRDLDGAARKEEDAAEHAKGHAKAKNDEAAGVDLAAPHEAVALQTAYEQAIARRAALTQADTDAKAANERAAAAQAKLDKELAGRTEAPSVEDAQQAVKNAEILLNSMKEVVAKLEEELAAAKEKQRQHETSLGLAQLRLDGVESYHRMLAALREEIEAGKVVGPSPEDLEQAERDVKAAGEAIETGVVVRRAKQALTEAEEQSALAARHEAQAKRLREAGKRTDETLANLVQCAPLRVVAGRLVIDDPERGEEYFSELSDGERWKLAIDLALDTVGEYGLIVVPQEAFGELSPPTRDLIHHHARQRKVHVLTALATAGELRCEQYQPSASDPEPEEMGPPGTDTYVAGSGV